MVREEPQRLGLHVKDRLPLDVLLNNPTSVRNLEMQSRGAFLSVKYIVAVVTEKDALIDFVELLGRNDTLDEVVVVGILLRWINMIELKDLIDHAPPLAHFLDGESAVGTAITLVFEEKRADGHGSCSLSEREMIV
jgi:hypothetical protein